MRHYFIDGYNLIFRLSKKRSSLEKQRSQIILLFNTLASQLKLNLTFVFDASGEREIESCRGHYDHLEIIYTGINESADDYILKQLQNKKDSHLETVVTSDRELAMRCRLFGAETQSIENFLLFLKRKKRREKRALQEVSDKSFKESDANLQRLLKIFEERLQDQDSTTGY